MGKDNKELLHWVDQEVALAIEINVTCWQGSI